MADGGLLFGNLAYGQFSTQVEVAALDYTIGIAPTGVSIADFAPLSGLGGGSCSLCLGFLSGADKILFGLFAALQDGTVLELPAILPADNLALVMLPQIH